MSQTMRKKNPKKQFDIESQTTMPFDQTKLHDRTNGMFVCSSKILVIFNFFETILLSYYVFIIINKCIIFKVKIVL